MTKLGSAPLATRGKPLFAVQAARASEWSGITLTPFRAICATTRSSTCGMERLDAAREIRSGVEHSAPGDHGNANSINLGVQHVHAMRLRLHPRVMNIRRRRSDREVLLNEVEMGTGQARSESSSSPGY